MQLQYHPKAANLAAQNNVVPANGIKVKDGCIMYVRIGRHVHGGAFYDVDCFFTSIIVNVIRK